MKKTLLLLIILFGAVLSSKAQYEQTLPKLGVGFNFGATVGPASSSFPAAGGAMFKLELPISQTPLSFTLTTGYTFYVSKDGYSAGYDYDSYSGGGYYSYGSVVSFVPVEAGLKLYVLNKIFIEGDVGASFNINSNSADYTGKKTALIYSPSVGYTIPFGRSERFGMDLSLGYESRIEPGGGYNQVAFRALFNFGI